MSSMIPCAVEGVAAGRAAVEDGGGDVTVEGAGGGFAAAGGVFFAGEHAVIWRANTAKPVESHNDRTIGNLIPPRILFP
jgi:hypothetical protein